MNTTPTPLVVHVVHRFDYGGLENGLVNLINGMPPDVARHAVVAVTECSRITERIRRDDVSTFGLGKQPGNSLLPHLGLYRLLRRLRPTIVHTRNVGTIEYQVTALLAGVRYRVHGEHGWDVADPNGANRRYRVLRRLLAPIIARFVALSIEIAQWLERDVGVSRHKIVRICNGVDLRRFETERRDAASQRMVVGTVTRFSAIKDPANTLEAFARARELSAKRGVDLRLIMVGDGELKPDIDRRAAELDLRDVVELPGAASDVAPWLRKMDLFVLGSRREGISNTILEAMAAGLPVVATATGGNPELVADGRTGRLVPTADSDAMAQAIVEYAVDDARRIEHGRAARARVEAEFSLDRMVEQYSQVYRDLLKS